MTASVTTGDAVNITQDAATIVGNAFSGFLEPVLTTAVEYAASPDLANPMTVQGPNHSPFSVALINLSPNTVYYYRATIQTASGRILSGAVKSFVTLQPLPVPIVTTGDAVNITEHAATIIGNTYSGIPGVVDQVAVQVDLSPDMTDPLTFFGLDGSPFAVALAGLQPNTRYYFRAAVSSTSGVFFGAVSSFMTTEPRPAAVVITGDATNILSYSATIINNQFSGISGTISGVGVQVSASPSMTSSMSVLGSIGSPFTVNLTNLQPNTTYYFRAFVNTSSGSLFGAIKSFTTPQRA